MDSSIIVITISVVLILVAILAVILIRQNKSGTYPHESEASSKAMGKGIAIGYAIGMGPGLAIGIALDNIGMGIAIGAGVGVSIGVAIGASLKKKEEAQSGTLIKKGSKQEEMKIARVLALIILMIGLLVLGYFYFAKYN